MGFYRWVARTKPIDAGALPCESSPNGASPAEVNRSPSADLSAFPAVLLEVGRDVGVLAWVGQVGNVQVQSRVRASGRS